MSFETNIPGHILQGDDKIVFGTVALGTDFGELTKADLERTAKRIEIENNRGGLRALILANPGLKLNLEAIFDSDGTPPGMGDEVSFPYVTGIAGRVVEGIKIMWEQNGSRKLSFVVEFYDSMGTADNPAFTVNASGVATTIPAP